MKQYTTNYTDTFIEVAEDCPVAAAQAPLKEPKSAALIKYEMLIQHPYQYTSDDVLYLSNGRRRGISRDDFFSKGQPCFRSSALTKRYGWGVHYNHDGKIALYAVESEAHKKWSADPGIKHVKAMRSAKNRGSDQNTL